MKAARYVRCVLPAVLLAAAGCSEPEVVRVLDEPKSTHPPGAPIAAEQKQYRTLAAMFPRDDAEVLKKKDANGSWWFFKMSGRAEEIAKYEADFFKLLDSVRFQENEENPIQWELPAGWTREPGSMARFATLKASDSKVEIAVSSAGGVLLMNVQRWWGQLWGKDRGTDVTAITLPDFSRLRTVNGRLAITVDLSGPKDPNAKDPSMGGPMMNPHNPHKGQ